MPMPRYKLRALLIVLALGPPVLAGGWFVYAWDRNARYVYELYQDPRRYPELEEWLVRHGKATRGLDGQLRVVPEKPRAAWWLSPEGWFILLIYGVVPQLIWLAITARASVIRWLSTSSGNQ